VYGRPAAIIYTITNQDFTILFLVTHSARNKSTVNEQIVEIFIHSSSKNFQPELQPNSEQKADEMHITPAIANAM
jgi:hypothetical protein